MLHLLLGGISLTWHHTAKSRKSEVTMVGSVSKEFRDLMIEIKSNMKLLHLDPLTKWDGGEAI